MLLLSQLTSLLLWSSCYPLLVTLHSIVITESSFSTVFYGSSNCTILSLFFCFSKSDLFSLFANSKKAKIQSLNLAGPIITALLPIGAEQEPEDIEEDVPARTAFRVIDTLATSLPPNQVFPPLFAQVMELSQSPNPFMRKSAIMAFGVVVEGCSLFIQPHLESLWPLIIGGLSDPEVVVRKAACSALMCLCEMLEEECATQHAVLLPVRPSYRQSPIVLELT